MTSRHRSTFFPVHWGQAFLLAVLLTLSAPAHATQPIPAFAEVKAGAVPSMAVLLARDGTPLAERRMDPQVRRLEWVGLYSFSPALKEALLAAEDKRFFEHSGVDWRAFVGALWHNLWYDHKRGASTLSMQLAGLLDPDLALGRNGAPRRSLGQKWDQALAAQALEARWTKEQILEAYLNLAPFRGDLQGVHAASRALFGKGPGELGRPEALILAVLLRGPNARPEVVAQRACVLSERIGAPSACAGAQRLAQLNLDRPRSAPRWDLAPHAARLLLQQAGERLSSSLDGEVQRQVLGGVRKLGGDGAGVVIDNQNAEVLAYVGAPESSSPDLAAQPRPAGSLLAPFAYGLALEKRMFTAASLLDDSLANHAPTVPEDRIWISARRALAEGLLDPAAFVQRQLADSLQERLRQADFDPARGEASLLQVAGLYRSLVGGGQWLAPRFASGGPERLQRRLLRAEAAFIIADILAMPAAEEGEALPYLMRSQFLDGRETLVLASDRYTVVLSAGGGGPRSAALTQLAQDVLASLHGASPAQRPQAPAGVVSSLVVFEPPLESPRREWFIRGTEQERVGIPRGLARIQQPASGVLVDAMALVDNPEFRLSLEATHAPPGVWWRLNGERLGSGNHLSWRPQAGRHVLDLMSAEGQILDSSIFAVRAPLD